MLCPFHFSNYYGSEWPGLSALWGPLTTTQGKCAAQVSDLHVTLEIKSSHLCHFKGLRMLGLSLLWDWPEGSL